MRALRYVLFGVLLLLGVGCDGEGRDSGDDVSSSGAEVGVEQTRPDATVIDRQEEKAEELGEDEPALEETKEHVKEDVKQERAPAKAEELAGEDEPAKEEEVARQEEPLEERGREGVIEQRSLPPPVVQRYPPAAMPLVDDSLLSEEPLVKLVNVALRLDEIVNIYVPSLEGVLRATGGEVDLDDARSYDIEVYEADVALTDEDLGELLDRYAYEDDGGELEDISVESGDRELTLRATLSLSGDSVEIRGYLEATPEGTLALHPTQLRREGKPKSELDEVWNGGLAGAEALRAEGDRIVIDLEQLLPPPLLKGRVVHARAERGRVLLTLEGDAPEPKRHFDGLPPNYVLIDGGELKVGKWQLSGAEVLFVDEEPSDPFGFSFRDYARQLFAKGVDVKADYSLHAVAPDYEDLAP